jgi:hypothetical protein
MPASACLPSTHCLSACLPPQVKQLLEPAGPPGTIITAAGGCAWVMFDTPGCVPAAVTLAIPPVQVSTVLLQAPGLTLPAVQALACCVLQGHACAVRATQMWCMLACFW